MSTYTANVEWEKKEEEDFLSGKYSREHKWTFDGGATVLASSAPAVVPVPFSVEANVDPEEAFLASLGSCHMLFFLYFAGRKRFAVESYSDSVTGIVAKNSEGKTAITEVELNPKITFSGEKVPTQEELDQLHHLAHENCFIANSVNCAIKINA